MCGALKLKCVVESNPGGIRIHLSDAETIKKCNDCGQEDIKAPTGRVRNEGREFGREIRNGERVAENQPENTHANPRSIFGGPYQNNQQRGESSSTRVTHHEAPIGNTTAPLQAPLSNTTAHQEAPVGNEWGPPQAPPCNTTTRSEGSGISVGKLADRILALYFPGYPTHHNQRNREEIQDTHKDIRAVFQEAESRVPHLHHLFENLHIPVSHSSLRLSNY